MEKKEVKQFEFADLYLQCNKCGADEVVQKKIQNGIQVVLPTTDSHELALVCTKCGNKIRLYYKESAPSIIVPEQIKKEDEPKTLIINEESGEGKETIRDSGELNT